MILANEGMLSDMFDEDSGSGEVEPAQGQDSPRQALPPLDRSRYDYHAMVSYRVWADKSTTEVLYYALQARALRVFWDKACLQDGAPWEDGFVAGLQKSRRIVALVSEKALDGIADKALTRPDNVLMEWELAVDKLEAGDSEYIVPLLVGEYIDSGHGRALKKFSAFGGLPNKPWPDAYSTTCKTRTIKQTMAKFFAGSTSVSRSCILSASMYDIFI
jgi:hypothetical protein